MRPAVTLLTAAALVATACAPNGPSDTARSTTEPFPTSPEVSNTSDPAEKRAPRSATGGGAGRFVSSLVAFEDCGTLLDHLRSEALERVTAWGLGNDGGYWIDDLILDDMSVEMSEDMSADRGDTDRAEADVAASSADDSDGDSAQAPMPASFGGADDGGDDGFSTTNVQEVGVDEPDIVKTDGRRIVTISDNVLTVVVANADDPVVAGRLRLNEGWNHELFLSGDRAFVLANDGSWDRPVLVDQPTGDAEAEFAETSTDLVSGDVIGPMTEAAVVYEIDLTGEPTITTTLTIEGRYLSARAIGDSVRLAVAGGAPNLPWLFPSGPASEERALEANRELVEAATLDDWIPSYRLLADGVDVGGPLLDCADVNRPSDFAGFEMVSVLDVDLGRGLADAVGARRGVGVLAAGQTVYSSMDRFYVATNTWVEPDATDAELRRWGEEYRTDLHAFAIAPGEQTEYVASGSIAGTLLNQFSIGEHGGFVRVLTTEGAPWDQDDLSETSLTVLAERDDELVEVGRVGGLGRGERLYAARLLGDVGFAVTFREIDPFYVLDLADPTDPKVAGELKIPGFSTYLHPVGDDRVLGLGQAATEDGMTTGLKLSLFDVSDPADPREISVWTLPNSQSVAEHDHRAFQMWGDKAIVPVQTWSNDFNGAIVFEIGDAITEVGRIDHGDQGPTSDCRALTSDDFPEDDSEFYWMAADPWTTLQLCGESEQGGVGTSYCEPIPMDEARNWFYETTLADEAFERLGVEPTDRIEICYHDGNWEPPVMRSVVIGDDLWTMTSAVLQANDLESLERGGSIPLR